MKSTLAMNTSNYMIKRNSNVTLVSTKSMALSFVIVVFMIQAIMHDFVDILGLEIVFMITKIVAVIMAGFVYLSSVHSNTPATKQLEFAWLAFAIVTLLYRNRDLLSGYWYIAFFYSATAALIFILSYSTDWIKTFFDALKLFSMIHAIATILFFAFPSLYSFYQPVIFSITGSLNLDGYKSGLTVHYSANAVFLSQGLVAYFSEIITHKKVTMKKWFFFLVILFALILTTKRAHLLFGFLSIFYVYYIQRGRFLRTIKFIALGALLLLAFLMLAPYVPAIDNTLQRFVGDNLFSMNGRDYIYEAAYNVFLESPVFGKGWNWFVYSDISRLVTRQYSWFFVGSEYIQVHNVYLQLLLEVGVIGFVLVIALFIKTFLASIELYNKLCRDNVVLPQFEIKVILFSIGYQTFFLCYCMTGNPLYDAMVYIVYFFCCATIIALRRKYGYLLTSTALKRRFSIKWGH